MVGIGDKLGAEIGRTTHGRSLGVRSGRNDGAGATRVQRRVRLPAWKDRTGRSRCRRGVQTTSVARGIVGYGEESDRVLGAGSANTDVKGPASGVGAQAFDAAPRHSLYAVMVSSSGSPAPSAKMRRRSATTIVTARSAAHSRTRTSSIPPFKPSTTVKAKPRPVSAISSRDASAASA
jgi:hypothetical protein